MTTFGGLVREVQNKNLLSVSDQLVFYQSHHHSLFLDQTVGDALGGEAWAVRRQAAFESAHALLQSVHTELGIQTPRERLDVASELFATMGHGKLVFEVNPEGGVVRSDELYYGSSFVAKYGAKVRNRKPMDAFAAGFASAAASLAFPSDWGHFEADEVSCVACRDSGCAFALSRRPDPPRFGTIVTRSAVEDLLARTPVTENDPEYVRALATTTRLLCRLTADARGAVRAFGANLAMIPVSYANQITYDTMHLVEARKPDLVPVFAALVREAAQMGVFHLLGGIITSPEWLADMGVALYEEQRLRQLLGIARGLGWGRWYFTEFFPGQSLVIRSPATQESAYYALRHGSTVRSRLFFQQGAALALMHLLLQPHADTTFAVGSYPDLFKAGARLHVEETRSPLRGDDVCEVVVEALSIR